MDLQLIEAIRIVIVSPLASRSENVSTKAEPVDIESSTFRGLECASRLCFFNITCFRWKNRAANPHSWVVLRDVFAIDWKGENWIFTARDGKIFCQFPPTPSPAAQTFVCLRINVNWFYPISKQKHTETRSLPREICSNTCFRQFELTYGWRGSQEGGWRTGDNFQPAPPTNNLRKLTWGWEL